MFIYNVKINKTGYWKFLLGILAVICISIFVVSIFKMINDMDVTTENTLLEDELPKADVAHLTPENYTNILKVVHDNPDKYIGQKIAFSGYVYRVPDLKENQFILARDMNMNNNQTIVVGFLCSLEHAKEFENYTWISIIGTIEKGTYNGDIPTVRIEQIERVDKPENSVVQMPDDTYIPTSALAY